MVLLNTMLLFLNGPLFKSWFPIFYNTFNRIFSILEMFLFWLKLSYYLLLLFHYNHKRRLTCSGKKKTVLFFSVWKTCVSICDGDFVSLSYSSFRISNNGALLREIKRCNHNLYLAYFLKDLKIFKLN